jgi:hypothetical protein
LKVFENRMLRRILGPKRDEVTGGWKNYIMRSTVICTTSQYVIRMCGTERRALRTLQTNTDLTGLFCLSVAAKYRVST